MKIKQQNFSADDQSAEEMGGDFAGFHKIREFVDDETGIIFDFWEKDEGPPSGKRVN